jgi:hypothetical protein
MLGTQELAFTEGYLAIEQTRLGERLRIDMAVPFETRDALRKRHLCRDFGIQGCAEKISDLRQHPRGRTRISIQNESGDGVERIE